MSEYEQVIDEIVKHGVVVKINKVVDDNYIPCERKYVGCVVELDFTEHDKRFKDEIEILKRQIEKLASIRTRCHESARDSFDSGNYGCLHIVTADELKNSNEKVTKIESELFDVHKSDDEYYNKCMDLTKQVTELESELEVKDNLLKIKNGLCGNFDDLPSEPISVANMLINAKIEYEPTSLQKALFKTDGKCLADKYSDDDLEQIAEHLLVYCKHNKDSEE